MLTRLECDLCSMRFGEDWGPHNHYSYFAVTYLARSLERRVSGHADLTFKLLLRVDYCRWSVQAGRSLCIGMMVN